jgi:molecular chaperone DnaJ
VIEVIPHPRFQRDGRNIHSTVKIHYGQATLGAKVKVNTLWGEETVGIPPGTQPGTVIRLRGKGIPDLHGGGRGDHVLEVQVIVPTTLSTEQRRALLDFQKTLPPAEDYS